MLSLPFWAAFAGVFFVLKWISDVWLSLPEPERPSHPAPSATAIQNPHSSPVAVDLGEAA